MTVSQEFLTLFLCMLATVAARFLPFLIFTEKKKTPAFILYLGKILPPAVFGMLLIYCLKDVSLLAGSHGLPELFALIITVALHLWKRKTLLSIAGGTVFYMLLLHFVF